MKTNQPPNAGKSFLDPKTILAFALTVAFFVAWHWYMDKKYPQVITAQSTQGAPLISSTGNAAVAGAAVTPNGDLPAVKSSAQKTSQTETLISYDAPNIAFQISSLGMGLKGIDIKTYRSRGNEPIVLGAVSERLPFATDLVQTGAPIDFTVEKSGDNEFTGHALIDGMSITKTIHVEPSLYAIDVEVKVDKPSAAFKGLSTTLSDVVVDPKSSTVLVPNYDRQDVFFHHDGGKTSRAVVTKEKGLDVSEKNVSLIALSSHYFAMAVVDSKTLLPRFEGKALAGGNEVTARLVYEPINRGDSFAIKYKGYAGPKSFEILEKVDPDLSTVVDYGMFGILGKPLWQLLKACYLLVGNYGVAIILMTLVVRFCVMPFNIYSFRSMKAMQRIQPQITALKERYKEDPRAMNVEVMALMKTNKANPLGGCLPILLQLPIFFALYQVLGQSIELYRAPFMFWIQDLSMSDRFYVLPVLMAGAMFAQQKLTPTTMDPAQAKIMMWMPLIFAFFMVSLPSGLTLYILVSTLFGIAQQLVFARDRRANSTPSATQPARI